MSDGYKPSIERVRDLYSWAFAWRTEDDIEGGDTDLSGLREKQRAEFDRALAAHDREVAAKALEDAGADWHALVMREKPPVTGATWLNRRAAAIREGRA